MFEYFICMYICAPYAAWSLSKLAEVVRAPVAVYEPTLEWWELNPDPLQEQVYLIAGPSLTPNLRCFILNGLCLFSVGTFETT